MTGLDRETGAHERSAPRSSSPIAPACSLPGGEPASVVCMVCGTESASDAVFCPNATCRKALGEFPFVLEEMRAQAQWHEILADRITAFVGKPHFFTVHVLWFALWLVINTGLLSFARRFDAYPFDLLGILLGVEAIFMTGFLLISQNAQMAHAEKRAELDYEVNVRTYREINEIDAMLKQILERLDDGSDPALKRL